MNADLKALSAKGLNRFHLLEPEAVIAVSERFNATLGSVYMQFGQRGRDACREDLKFHLEFLTPVLQFGLLAPMVDYLCWLASVLVARGIPAEHLALSLEWLSDFFAQHMDASDGAVVTAALEAVAKEFLAASETSLAPVALPELGSEAKAFCAALLAGDQQEALAIVEDCLDVGRSLIDVEVHVIQPAMYSIGQKWQENKATVAQEHISTAIVQSVMTVALLRAKLAAPYGKRVLLACVAGNHHSIGLRMVADSFQLAGWEIQYLGANVPTRSLVEQIGEWRPNLVGLSLSFAQQLRVVKDLIVQMEARFGRARPPVIIGGLAVNRFDRLAGMVGANAHGVDAQSAIRVADGLVAS